MTEDKEPLVSFKATPHGHKSPFCSEVSFELREGSCVLLKGNSGIGKTTLVSFLEGLTGERTLSKLDIHACCRWNALIPPQQCCGVLFQQTTLIDEFTVAGNVSVTLEAQTHECRKQNEHHVKEIKQLLESVGLDYARDGWKKPGEQ
jgi:ABC-type lipoprotein export system ATPase subunit